MNTYSLSFPCKISSLHNLQSTVDGECIKYLQILYKLQDSQFKNEHKQQVMQSMDLFQGYTLSLLTNMTLQAFQQTETFSTFYS